MRFAQQRAAAGITPQLASAEASKYWRSCWTMRHHSRAAIAPNPHADPCASTGYAARRFCRPRQKLLVAFVIMQAAHSTIASAPQ